jgi:hypothetical protein
MAFAIPAPVLPMVTNASASPFFTRSMPMAIEFFASLLRAFKTSFSPLSSIVNASGAWTIRMGRLPAFCASNMGLMIASLPTKMISTPYSRAACTAPSTSGVGKLSLPIASTTIRAILILLDICLTRKASRL